MVNQNLQKNKLTVVISKAKLQRNEDIMVENYHKGLQFLLECKRLTLPYKSFFPMLKSKQNKKPLILR